MAMSSFAPVPRHPGAHQPGEDGGAAHQAPRQGTGPRHPRHAGAHQPGEDGGASFEEACGGQLLFLICRIKKKGFRAGETDGSTLVKEFATNGSTLVENLRQWISFGREFVTRG